MMSSRAPPEHVMGESRQWVHVANTLPEARLTSGDVEIDVERVRIEPLGDEPADENALDGTERGACRHGIYVRALRPAHAREVVQDRRKLTFSWRKLQYAKIPHMIV